MTTDVETAAVRGVMPTKEDASEIEEAVVARAAARAWRRVGGDRAPRVASPFALERRRSRAAASRRRCSATAWRAEVREIGRRRGGVRRVLAEPFASLLRLLLRTPTATWATASRGDPGVVAEEDDMRFLVAELYRVIAPGRCVSFHCMNLPTSKERDGFIGIRDFRGDLIRMFQGAGFIYHSEVTIWKDPVTAMQRTKALGLLNKQKNKDSAMSRQGIPDYLVTMRKPGENAEPIRHTDEEFPISVWQKLASPVWIDVNPSRTLNHRAAREQADERHICPLQLDVIERAVDLWSRPGDLVLSPFMGIGSEGYVAVKKGRRFVGIELKASYWRCAVANLEDAEREAAGKTLFDFLEVK